MRRKAALDTHKAVRHVVEGIVVARQVLLQRAIADRFAAIIDRQHRADIGVNRKAGQRPQQMLLVIGLLPTAALGVGNRHYAIDARNCYIGAARGQGTSKTRRARGRAEHDDEVPRTDAATARTQITGKRIRPRRAGHLRARSEAAFVESIGLDMISEVRRRGQFEVNRTSAEGVEHALVADVVARRDCRDRSAKRQFPREQFVTRRQGSDGEAVPLQHCMGESKGLSAAADPVAGFQSLRGDGYIVAGQRQTSHLVKIVRMGHASILEEFEIIGVNTARLVLQHCVEQFDGQPRLQCHARAHAQTGVVAPLLELVFDFL